MSRRIRRTRDGGAEPIPPTEYVAWLAATGNIVYPYEYAILGEMDAAYCDETNNEIGAYFDDMRDQGQQT